VATMTGALAAVSAQGNSIVLHQATGPLLPSGGRSLGHLHRCLEGLDRLGVLLGEPIDAEVEIDPRRRDGAVTGLGLNGFDGHPSLTQSGEAGMPELMAGGGRVRPAHVLH